MINIWVNITRGNARVNKIKTQNYTRDKQEKQYLKYRQGCSNMIRLQLQATGHVNIPEMLCCSTLLVYVTYISGQHFLRPVQQCKWDQLILPMKKVIGEEQYYFGNCTHGGMFFEKVVYLILFH